MKFNKWTLGLAAVGAVSLASTVRADEMKALNTAISNTTISGYVDVAAQYNLGDAGRGNTAPITTHGRNGMVDGFSLNSVNITLEKALDESPWAAGYRIDVNAGQDALNPLSTSSRNQTSVGIRQAYVALRTPVGNGIDWKIGAFDGVTGYEGNTGYSNPNYSRSYAYALNPASEVGLLASYKICDVASVQAGIANRMSGTQNISGQWRPSSKDFIATAALTAPDSWGWVKGSVLNFGTVQTFDNGGVNNYSVNGTFATPVAGLKVGLAYDKVQSLQANAADGNIYGAYVTYQATEKLGFNVRGEYVDGQNLGFFNNSWSTYVPYDPVTDTGGYNVYHNSNGKGEELTFTVQYDLWANVVSRVEARWDHTETGAQYNDNNTENAFLLALNVVYKF